MEAFRYRILQCRNCWIKMMNLWCVCVCVCVRVCVCVCVCVCVWTLCLWKISVNNLWLLFLLLPESVLAPWFCVRWAFVGWTSLPPTLCVRVLTLYLWKISANDLWFVFFPGISVSSVVLVRRAFVDWASVPLLYVCVCVCWWPWPVFKGHNTVGDRGLC